MGILKTEKILQLKSQQGRSSLRVVREHYLREDVPCLSPCCLADCKKASSGISLPENVTHYVIPDYQTSRNFLEVLEIPELTGLIFMQTVTNLIQHDGGRRVQRRLSNLLKNPHKHSVVFYNEFQRYSYCPREPGETVQQWQLRSVYAGAAWYHNHLVGGMPLIILSDDAKFREDMRQKTPDVFILPLGEYLKNFWPDLQPAHDLYESLCSSQVDKNKDEDYRGYLPQEVLKAGLRTNRFIQGRLNVNKHNAQHEAFVTPMGASGKEGQFESEIFISGSLARNRTVHGDQVVIEILPRSEWKGRSLAIHDKSESQDDGDGDGKESVSVMQTGRVVGVLQRGWRDYVACFAQDEAVGVSRKRADKVLVIPYDWRIPKIRISTSQLSALKDHRIVVRIDSWEPDSQYPNGHFVRSLGVAGDLETDIAALLIENNISVGPFSEALMKELPEDSPASPWLMEELEVSKRRDLRETHLIFSIDPKGCEDVDDTLSVKRLENGNLELGVHIADVTHFVKHNSYTDLEARSRSTTVYLADRRYDMLPEVLSANLCSLLGDVDRYAMSVIWELDADYEVVDVWFGRTVIRSAYKLFYEVAQDLYNGAETDYLVENIPELQNLSEEVLQKKLEDLRWAVSTLMETARNIKAKRTSGGALELEGIEVQVQLDKNKAEIEDLVPKQPLEVHETIAECMIFANHWVAKKICQAFPSQALLRHHPLPRQEHFDTLVNCAKSKGFDVDTSSNKALADSLDACVDPSDPNVNKLLRTLATQAMSNAAYLSTGSHHPDQYFHYGLALGHYTHFTSPIRRYADILVHRLLMAAMKQEETTCLMTNKELQETAQHINEKHRAAQYVQRDSQQLFQTLFFQKLLTDEQAVTDAIIFQLKANGVLAFIPRYGIKGAVYLKDKDGQVVYVVDGTQPTWTSGSLSLKSSDITVNSTLGSQTYRLFDHITVRIKVQPSHAHAANLKLELLSNHPHIIVGTEASSETNPRSDIIKAVTDAADMKAEQEHSLSTRLAGNFAELKQLYGQTTDPNSPYAIFQDIQRMALYPDL